MKTTCTFGSNKEDFLDLWCGRDKRQLSSPNTTWADRQIFFEELKLLLQKYGTANDSSEGRADFHFDPAPDPDVPCFLASVFQIWPEGLLLRISSLIDEFSRTRGHSFFLHIDLDSILISLLPAGEILVFFDAGRIQEDQVRKEIAKGLAQQ